MLLTDQDERSVRHLPLATCRSAREIDWVVEFDIRAFFDSVPHDLVVRAVEGLRLPAWALPYVKRWLTAQVIRPDGETRARDKGTPQGSAGTRTSRSIPQMTSLLSARAPRLFAVAIPVRSAIRRNRTVILSSTCTFSRPTARAHHQIPGKPHTTRR